MASKQVGGGTKQVTQAQNVPSLMHPQQQNQQIVSLIWEMCDLLRGTYERGQQREIVLPFTLLRRLDCVLADSRAAVLEEAEAHVDKPDAARHELLERASGLPFYNTSEFDFSLLANTERSAQVEQNLKDYIDGFSDNIQEIFSHFKLNEHIAKLSRHDLLHELIKVFAGVDLSPKRFDNTQMGYVFEELIRVGAEQASSESGDHFTPREVVKLMVNLVLAGEGEWSEEAAADSSHQPPTSIYDPTCGTGGLLSAAEKHIMESYPDAKLDLFGQDINEKSWAICKADMLIKGRDEGNIALGNTLTDDAFGEGRGSGQCVGRKFDYMFANPPFGVSWKSYKKEIERERDEQGESGRFGAGTPRVSDGSLLFLQHMISKMRPADKGGSRIAIVFNGSPLFSGDAGSGESEIRRWIVENDWLEAIVALPDQMFYNTGISTYIWLLTNRKEPRRQGKIQLIDGREFYQKMRKSLGNKRNELSDAHIDELTEIHGNFEDGETRDLTDEDPITHSARTRPRVVSKVFANSDFGFRKITVERPFEASKQTDTDNASDNMTLGDLGDFGEGDTGGGGAIRAQKAGQAKPDPKLRDTESVPLSEDIDAFMSREVLPHHPDAWVDDTKTKVGYEIPFNRHFFEYEPPRPLEEIRADIVNDFKEIAILLDDLGLSDDIDMLSTPIR